MTAGRLYMILWRRALTWWRGRPVRPALLGLPALVCGLVLGGLAIAAALTPTQEVEARYLVHAEKALHAKDASTALVCYDRLAYRSAERPDLLFGMAQAADAAGQTARARALIAELAPLNRPGYGPAHLWFACQLLRNPNPSGDVRKTAEVHLLHALDARVENSVLAHSLLCELYMNDGDYDQAEPHLLKAVKVRPFLRLRAAQLYAQRGDKERARGECQLVIAHFRERCKADPADDFSRLAWADATTLLGSLSNDWDRFRETLKILDEGFAISHNTIYSTFAGRVYITWYDTLGHTRDAKPADRLAVLQEGLTRDSSNQELLNRMLALTQLAGDDGTKATEALQNLLASGKATATAHFALGVVAMRQGRTDEARLHWEQASALSPDMPAVANNLAMMLATAKEPDLPRALGLIDLALERSPKEPNFHHTRGTILQKMGRHKEALAELETALPSFPDSAKLHEQLADVYEHLGIAGLAAEHRRRAEAAAQTAAPGSSTPK
jgi:tetratricopeptide (TPR) repeat protein